MAPLAPIAVHTTRPAGTPPSPVAEASAKPCAGPRMQSIGTTPVTDGFNQATTRVAEAATLTTPRTYGPINTAAQVALAPIIVFLRWGLQPLTHLAGLLMERLHLDGLERRIAALPPYAALALFAGATLTLFPVKLISLHLLASGYPLSGIAVLLAAKVLGTALFGRLFTVTKPKLMTIGWFAKAYNAWLPWERAVMERVHQVGDAMRRVLDV